MFSAGVSSPYSLFIACFEERYRAYCVSGGLVRNSFTKLYCIKCLILSILLLAQGINSISVCSCFVSLGVAW